MKLLPLFSLVCLKIQIAVALPVDDNVEDELQCTSIVLPDPEFNVLDGSAIPVDFTERSVQDCRSIPVTLGGPADPWVKADNHYRVVVSRYTARRAAKSNMEQFWSHWKEELHVDFCRARQTDPSITASSDVEGRKIDFQDQNLGLQLKLTPVKDIYSFSYKEMVSVRRRLELWTSEFRVNEAIPGAKLLVADIKSNEVVASGYLIVNTGEEAC